LVPHIVFAFWPAPTGTVSRRLRRNDLRID
jgi:hypothetical protein